VEHVIKILQKKPLVLPSLYKDMDITMIAKVPIPSSLELYNKIHHDDFPEFIPHRDLKLRVLDDQVFQNIKLLSLYMIAAKNLVFPYIETLEWIINHTKDEKCVINNVDNQCVGVFLPIEVRKH
jgi:hypothetical protein